MWKACKQCRVFAYCLLETGFNPERGVESVLKGRSLNPGSRTDSRMQWENLETQDSQVRRRLRWRNCDEECSGESRCSLSTDAFFDGNAFGALLCFFHADSSQVGRLISLMAV